MKKRIASMALALTAVATMGLNAYADDLPFEQGDANISFKEGDTSIVDPGYIDGVANINLDFGAWEITPFRKVYESFGENAASGIALENRFAGFSLLHTKASAPWYVDVAVAGFYLEDGSQTMEGFTLSLTPDLAGNANESGKKTPITTPGNQVADEDKPTASAATISAKGDGNLGDTKTIFSAEAGKGVGAWGGNWSGSLDVLADSATTVGSATAVMKWSIRNTPA